MTPSQPPVNSPSLALVDNLDLDDLDSKLLSYLLPAATELVRMVSRRDKQASWDLVAHQYQEILNADQVAFFLMYVGEEKEALRLLARYPRPGLPPVSSDEQVAESPLDEEEVRALQVYLESQPLTVWHHDYELPDLRRDVAARTEGRLFAEAYSTLWAVVKDHHGMILGVIAAARSYREGDRKLPPFGPKEQTAAKGLGLAASQVLELMRALKMMRDLRKQVHRSTCRDDILRATLSTALRLLRSDRGGIVTRGGDSGPPIVYGPQVGAGRPEAGGLVPSDNPARLVLEAPPGSQQLRLDPQVARALLQWGNGQGRIGVVEVAAPVTHQFDAVDLDLLQWVARHAASDCELVEHTRDLDHWEAELTKDDARTVAKKLMERIKNEGLDGVLVYVRIPRTKHLMSIDGIDPTGQRDFRKIPYIYSEEDKSAATWAYKHVAFSCQDPQQDPINRVNKDGLAALAINGSLFALPLGEPGNRFGSVIAWFGTKQCSNAELHATESRLRELVLRATNPMRLALSTRKAVLQDQVTGILQQMMRESDLNKNLDMILKAIVAVGFRRVRLYQFRYGDTLLGMMSQGMNARSALFGGKEPIEVPVQRNNYTRLMYDGFCQAREQASQFQREHLLARLYPLKDLSGDLIKDDSAPVLGNPAEMPWAEVPVISAGNLYGLIAADKLLEDVQEWDQILETDLDALDALAQLAGQAFAMDEKRGMLIQKHLRVLDDYVGLKEDPRLVQRRLLLFLAHGEQGLGFSRAMLFTSSPHGPGPYVFCNAVGAATGKENERNISNTRTMSLENVLREASLSHDEALNEKLKGLELPGVSHGGAALGQVGPRYCPGSPDLPVWVNVLCERLKESANERPQEILAVRLNAGEEDLGLFVVDRKWDIGLIKADEEALESFGRYAAQILLRHRVLQHRLADIDKVIDALIHEPSRMLPPVQNLVEESIDCLQRHDTSQLEKVLESLRVSVQQFAQVFAELTEVFGPNPVMLALSGQELAQGISQRLSDSVRIMNEEGIKLQYAEDWPQGTFPVNLQSVLIVIRNVFRNAREAFREVLSGAKWVRLSGDISLHDSANASFHLHIENNGPPIRESDLGILNNPLSVHTTKAGKKGGCGLFQSRYILRKFGGRLVLANIEQGVRVTLTIPFKLGGANDG